jgi:hypothetical protein
VLPFEFAADSSKIGGAGVRLVVAKAERRFSYRQLVLIQRLIQPVWFYVIGDAIDRGELEPAPNWWRISCVTPRRVTTDAGREAQQNRGPMWRWASRRSPTTTRSWGPTSARRSSGGRGTCA